MKRRGFLRSILGGVAAAVAAPFVARAVALSERCDVYPVLLVSKEHAGSIRLGQRASMSPCPRCGVLRYSAGAFCTCPGKLAERDDRFDAYVYTKGGLTNPNRWRDA